MEQTSTVATVLNIVLKVEFFKTLVHTYAILCLHWEERAICFFPGHAQKDSDGCKRSHTPLSRSDPEQERTLPEVARSQASRNPQDERSPASTGRKTPFGRGTFWMNL